MKKSSLRYNYLLGFSVGTAALAICGASYAGEGTLALANVCASSATSAIDGYVPCQAAIVHAPPVVTTAADGVTPIVAARSDQGSATNPIDAFNYCRYIDNHSTGVGTPLFVPFKTFLEWTSFINNKPSFVTLTPCARQTTYTLTPDRNCASPSPPSATVTLPYDRVLSPALTLTDTQNFTCTDGTETATATFTAGASTDGSTPGFASSGWVAPVVTYVYAANAQCGSANGTGVDSAPSTNLCDAGTASAVSGRGLAWNWTCAGSGGGTTASCSAARTCGGQAVTSIGGGAGNNQVIYGGIADVVMSISGNNNLICEEAGDMTINIIGDGNILADIAGNDLVNVTGNNNNLSSAASGCDAYFISGNGNLAPIVGFVTVNGTQVLPPSCSGATIGAGTYVEP